MEKDIVKSVMQKFYSFFYFTFWAFILALAIYFAKNWKIPF